jgi:hypothetical protein
MGLAGEAVALLAEVFAHRCVARWWQGLGAAATRVWASTGSVWQVGQAVASIVARAHRLTWFAVRRRHWPGRGSVGAGWCGGVGLGLAGSGPPGSNRRTDNACSPFQQVKAPKTIISCWPRRTSPQAADLHKQLGSMIFRRILRVGLLASGPQYRSGASSPDMTAPTQLDQSRRLGDRLESRGVHPSVGVDGDVPGLRSGGHVPPHRVESVAHSVSNRRGRWGAAANPSRTRYRHRQVVSPFRDRHVATRSGQHRAHRRGQHRHQLVPYALAVAWIGAPRQGNQQIRPPTGPQRRSPISQQRPRHRPREQFMGKDGLADTAHTSMIKGGSQPPWLLVLRCPPHYIITGVSHRRNAE